VKEAVKLSAELSRYKIQLEHAIGFNKIKGMTLGTLFNSEDWNRCIDLLKICISEVQISLTDVSK